MSLEEVIQTPEASVETPVEDVPMMPPFDIVVFPSDTDYIGEMNKIINNFYSRDEIIRNKLNETTDTSELDIFYKKINEELFKDESALWALSQYLCDNLSIIDGWDYKYEFMLTYNNHKNQQYYSPKIGFTRERSFITDLMCNILNITTPARNQKPEHINVLYCINTILDVKYGRGNVSDTSVWLKDLWAYFEYIINSPDRDIILNLWIYGKQFNITIESHKDNSQLFYKEKGWTYQQSFVATFYSLLYHGEVKPENTEDGKEINKDTNEDTSVSENNVLVV